MPLTGLSPTTWVWCCLLACAMFAVPVSSTVNVGTTAAGTEADPCQPSSGSGTDIDPYVFEASIDYFVSDTGYYKFKECEGARPVLEMEAGSHYKFLQTDVTNWMHPLGFAYYPDGAHKDKDELEEGVVPPGSSTTCDTDSSCQTPMYYRSTDDGASWAFLGGESGDGGFGLDAYEPQFKDWAEGLWGEYKYSVDLRITDDATAYFYYFCHIHDWMSGKIIVTDSGSDVARTSNGAGEIALYDAVALNAEDTTCGFSAAPHYGDAEGPSSFGSDDAQCDTLHLCGTDGDFKNCLEAVDCHMTYNMRVTHADDPVETFMRQMIPHHQNAVNMAKVLLKLDAAGVDDADAALGEDAFIGSMLRAIINGQNMQIMDMYGYLEHLAETKSADEVALYDTDCASTNIMTRDDSCHCGIECALKVATECPCKTEPMRTNNWKGTDADPCEPSSGAGTEADPYVFEASIDYFVSDTGYYKFKDCDAVRPVLKMVAGSHYKFLQTDVTNWMHPLGFAYYPDGAHKDKDELEEGVVPPGSSTTCDTDSSCQTPMYYRSTDDGASWAFLGGESGDGGFGLDAYEPQFKDWAEGLWGEYKYSVDLRITDDATAYFYYFCHIHDWMSGKIIVTNADGSARTSNGAGDVELYEAVSLTDDDTTCGTSAAPHYGDHLGASYFGKDSGACDTMHLCGPDGEFKNCMEALDCHMTYNMRTTHGDDPVATFMRQMIPHHQNAVNMAKVLLKLDAAGVDDADAALGEDAFIGSMLRAIINGQNMQIMDMYNWLESQNGFEETYDSECAHGLRVFDGACDCTTECDAQYSNECMCQGTEAEPCEPSSGAGTEADPYVFEASIDYFVSDTGYYKFKDCDAVRPVLKMVAGSHYKFLQTDVTNWMHPLGFAYYPDGAHKDKDELEEGVVPPGSSTTCDTDSSCQTPMYYRSTDDGASWAFLGGESGDGGFGLDAYEPQFKDWAEGLWGEYKYSVDLRITDDATAYFYYFCHIHDWMSGKIVVYDGDTPRTTNGAGVVNLYSHVALTEEDMTCGTSAAPHYGDFLGPSHFGADDAMCETKHLCGTDGEYKDCMEALDCHMTYNMRTTHGPTHDPVETFMRQMIPHHQNAVNMAKVLLKLGATGVNAADTALGEDAFVGSMLRAIINGQNMQIMNMYAYLEHLASKTSVSGFVATFDPECAATLRRTDTSCHCGIECATKLMTDCDCLSATDETGSSNAGTDENPCEPSSGAGTEADPYVFEASIDYFVSDTGYYKFKDCDAVRPVLKMVAGSHYKFLQTDVTNWMHPLGFAYYPDGAHKDKDELEEGVVPPGSSTTCDTDSSCQTPMYYRSTDDGASWAFLGGESGDGGFGLDAYEPQFKDWAEGLWGEYKYSVDLRITDDATAYFYYFCHVHDWMSGKIIVANADGSARTSNGAGDVELYEAVSLTDDDMTCGTSAAPHYGDHLGASYFGKDSRACDTMHLCGEDNDFKNCMEAVDCHMTYNMRTTHGDDPVATFMRQMIPHHQNAVNMAKVLLKLDAAGVAAADTELGEDAFVGSMLRAIINGQNMQIMDMYNWLESQNGFEEVYDVECAQELRPFDADCNCDAECATHFNEQCDCDDEPATTPSPTVPATTPNPDPTIPTDFTDPAKVVSITVRLEQSESEFRAQELAFRQAMAAAVGTAVTNVKVVSVTELTVRRVGRHLLATAVDIETEIGAASEAAAASIASNFNLDTLNAELDVAGLPAAQTVKAPAVKGGISGKGSTLKTSWTALVLAILGAAAIAV